MAMAMKGLRGMVVMVTGASSGLGRDFCLSLASHRCHVVAAARRTNLLRDLLQQLDQQKPAEEEAEEAEEEIVGSRPYHALIELDVSIAEESLLDAAVQKAWDAFGRIDVLVNNAGLSGRQSSLVLHFCFLTIISHVQNKGYVYVLHLHTHTWNMIRFRGVSVTDGYVRSRAREDSMCLPNLSMTCSSPYYWVHMCMHMYHICIHIRGV